MNDATAAASPSMEQIKQDLRTTWMAGDFGVIAKPNEKLGEDFAHRLRLPPGPCVLDIACGTGNVAIPLARMGAKVTGVDIAPNLVEQAQARAAREGLEVAFDEGDAENLPYADGSFDAVVTMFGAMFAPRPEIVSREMARVLRPGGLLAMANWNPESFTGQMFRVGSKHVPPPPSVGPPAAWGQPETVRERLTPWFDNIETELVPIEFNMPMPPSGAVALFRTCFRPVKMAFSRLDEAGQQAMAADLERLWAGANIAADPANHTRVRNEYLQVTANRK